MTNLNFIFELLMWESPFMKTNILFSLSLSFFLTALMPLHATDDAASITEVVVGPVLIASGVSLCCLGGWCLKRSKSVIREADRDKEIVVREYVAVNGCELSCDAIGYITSCAGGILTTAGVALTTVDAIQLSKN